MNVSTRVAEVVFGCLAALLPLAELGEISGPAAGVAIGLSAVAAVGAICGSLRSWSLARGLAAVAIVGNGFVFSTQGQSPSAVLLASVVLWLDAGLLLMFLLCGGIAEAGVREVSTSTINVHGPRVAVALVVLAGLVGLQQFDVGAAAWLVFAAMAAGVGALVLARRTSG